jgi:hypothetical protein
MSLVDFGFSSDMPVVAAVGVAAATQ